MAWTRKHGDLDHWYHASFGRITRVWMPREQHNVYWVLQGYAETVEAMQGITPRAHGPYETLNYAKLAAAIMVLDPPAPRGEQP